MKILRVVGRCLAFLGVTLGIVLLLLISVIYILEKGPSPTAKTLFVRAAAETSRMGFLGKMFLSEAEVEEILKDTSMIELEEGETNNTELIQVEEDNSDLIEIIEVRGEAYRGTLMIIHDPSRVFTGIIPEFGYFDGMTVKDVISVYNDNNYDIIGGVNGGDFVDYGTNNSATGQPLGAVISEGEVVYAESGDYDEYYHLACLTNDNKLVLGNISINQAIEMGVRDAIYCKHETGPFLVIDGKAMVNEVPNSSSHGGGPNPRTAIGQRADGAILLLVVDGRQANSLGATFKDLAYCMLDYGAVNAAAMDGGTSSQMVYEGQLLNHPYSAFGARRCPTSWLITE